MSSKTIIEIKKKKETRTLVIKHFSCKQSKSEKLEQKFFELVFLSTETEKALTLSKKKK